MQRKRVTSLVMFGHRRQPIQAELAHLPRSLIFALWDAFDTVSAMTWKPSDDIDREVRNWMKARGWDVTRVNYDSERQVYAWRHDVRGGPSPILRISRRVLEDYPLFAVLYHLDKLKVARAIRNRPADRLVVMQNALKVSLEHIL